MPLDHCGLEHNKPARHFTSGPLGRTLGDRTNLLRSVGVGVRTFNQDMVGLSAKNGLTHMKSAASKRPSKPDIAHKRSVWQLGTNGNADGVEIPDGASCFAFDPFCKVEILGKFILDKLPAGQQVQVP